MYNAAGPGQAMDEDIRKRIERIGKQMDIKILVSLSCTIVYFHKNERPIHQ